jgi:hypothetical protein
VGGVEHETAHTGQLARAALSKRRAPARTKFPTIRPCASPWLAARNYGPKSGHVPPSSLSQGGVRSGIVNKFALRISHLPDQRESETCGSGKRKIPQQQISNELIGFCHFHFLARLRGRLIEIGRDARKTIVIATVYPIKSAAIVISTRPPIQLEGCRWIKRKAVTWGTVDYRMQTSGALFWQQAPAARCYSPRSFTASSRETA